MVTDARTSNRNYQRPHPDNRTSEEFTRLISALNAIDADVATVIAALASKADASALAAYQALAAKNVANGYAGLDAASKLVLGQLPILDGSQQVMNQYLPVRLLEQAVIVTDWNTATASGWYRSNSGSSNAPGAQFYVGFVIQYAADYVLQQLVQRGGGIAWQRAMVAGVWGAWARVYNTAADLDTRYQLLTNSSYRLIADITPANGDSFVDIAALGHRFLRFLIGRAQPLTDGAQFRLQQSTDGTTFTNLSHHEGWLSDIALTAGEVRVSDLTNMLTGGAATGVSSTTNNGGWCGEIRIDNAAQARPLVGSYDGTWKNGAVINHIRGTFFDTGTTARTHFRLRFGSGGFEGGRIVVMGVL